MTRVRQLAIILLALALVLGSLVAVYFFILNPPQKKAEVKGIQHLYSIYGWGSRPDQLLKRPHGVAADDEGNIYVTDGSGRVVVFDSQGDFVRTFGARGKTPGSFRGAMGIAVDSKNKKVYVADRVRFRLVIYTTKGKFLNEIPVLSPLTPMVYKDKVYLATYGPINVYDLNGKQIDQWGARGRKAGEYDFPHGLAADSKGNIYVSDTNNTRLVVLNSRGEPIASKGMLPTGPGIGKDPQEFGMPAGITMDDKGRLFIVDAFDFSVKAYNLKGQQIAIFGGNPGELDGEFSYPDGIAFIGDKTFAVADKFNDRVQVLRLIIPGEETLRDRIPKWAYYLLLIPLLLLLLAFGRRKHIAHEDFISKAVADKKMRLVAAAIKRVYVTQDVYDKYSEREEEGFLLAEVLVARKYNEKKAERFAEAYQISEKEAAYLACAVKRKLEAVLLSRNIGLVDAPNLKELAEANKIKTQNYEEFIRKYEIEDVLTDEERVLELDSVEDETDGSESGFDSQSEDAGTKVDEDQTDE